MRKFFNGTQITCIDSSARHATVSFEACICPLSNKYVAINFGNLIRMTKRLEGVKHALSQLGERVDELLSLFESHAMPPLHLRYYNGSYAYLIHRRLIC